MTDELQGPRVRKVSTTVEKGKTFTTEVERPVGYERRLTPAERDLVRFLARQALENWHK
jgi:hypothetical protein